MGKSTISMAIFNSKLLSYQRLLTQIELSWRILQVQPVVHGDMGYLLGARHGQAHNYTLWLCQT